MWERYNVAGQQAMSAGKHKDAESHFQLALTEAEKLGETDARLPTSLNNLANCLRAQGRLEEAEPLYQRALSVKEKAVGPFHKDLVVILENYATPAQGQQPAKRSCQTRTPGSGHFQNDLTAEKQPENW
ncbi:MAG: tetratricopeptide repeat protein [Candidatus Melainabacteria bacterium]|nr:tetratricopeptide repeat protein [Candidatus Melainabacteria bacterium]